MWRLVGRCSQQPLTLILLGLLLMNPIACKRKKNRSIEQVTQSAQPETSGPLSSMVQAADPRTQRQLTKGFYAVEQNAWRWTEGSFSASLRPPLGSSRKGAMLVLKFSIPDLVLEKLKKIRLSASVNGVALSAEEYSKPGEYTYSREVPATALTSEAVSVDFNLDKFLPPTPPDIRELGVVVHAIGFEAR
ncbi:MAG: hypothetical protein M3Z32_08540 [Acidobacteriota bacterium]|nr:hypothetical protein [Acidobacteriota bacterium]